MPEDDPLDEAFRRGFTKRTERPKAFVFIAGSMVFFLLGTAVVVCDITRFWKNGASAILISLIWAWAGFSLLKRYPK